MSDGTSPEDRRESPLALVNKVFLQHREQFCRLINARISTSLARRIDSDDVLQEAWLSAATRLRYLSGSEPPEILRWLHWIVMQTLVDLYRRHAVAQSRSVTRESSILMHVVASTLEKPETPSDILVAKELTAAVEVTMQQLKAADREVLTLRHAQALTNDEVAARLGIGKSGASNRYVRALARLERLLRQQGNIP